MSMLKDKMQIDNRTPIKVIRSGQEIDLSGKDVDVKTYNEWKDSKIEALEIRLKEAEQALQFYANKSEWEPEMYWSETSQELKPTGSKATVANDKGNVALEYFKKWSEE